MLIHHGIKLIHTVGIHPRNIFSLGQQLSAHSAPSNVVPNNTIDDDLNTTYDYDKILPKNCHFQAAIPANVHVHASTTNDTIVSTDTQSALPFLTSGPETALPKYSAKSEDDINEFIYKLYVLF